MTISPGAAAGLAIGATLDIILIFGMVYYYYRQRRQRILDELAAQQAQHDQEAAVAVASQIRRHHHHHHQQQRQSRDPTDHIPPSSRRSHSQRDTTEAAGTREARLEPDQESTDTGCYSRAASLDQRIMTWRDQSGNTPGGVSSRSSSHSHPASLTSPFTSAEDPVEHPVQHAVELALASEDNEKSEIRRSESDNGGNITPSANSQNDDVSSLSLNDWYEKRSALSSVRQKVSLAELSIATIEPSRSGSHCTERQVRGQAESSHGTEVKMDVEVEVKMKGKETAEVVGIQLSPVGDSFASMMLGSGYDPAESSVRMQSEPVTGGLHRTNTPLNPFATLTSTNATSPSTMAAASRSPTTSTTPTPPTPTTRSTESTPSQSPSSTHFTQISATPPTLPPPAWTRDSASLPVSLFTQWNRPRSSGIGGAGLHEREQRGGGGYWVL